MYFTDVIQQRYIIVVFGFFLTIITSISKFSISITITEMVKSDYNVTNNESTDVCSITSEAEVISLSNQAGEFDWSSRSQGLIISAVFWVYAFLQPACGVLSERYGAKIVLVSGQLLSGLCMIIFPPVARYAGIAGVLVIRVLIGIGQAAVYPGLSFLLANWVPAQETSSLGSIILIGENVGIVVAMAVSGFILGNIDNSWDLTFYLYGVLTIIWCLLWILFGYNDPNSNPYISENEKEYLRNNISKGIDKKDLPTTPVKSMVKSTSLWACLLAHVGRDWGIISLTSDLPKYMKYVLHYDIEANGILSALPYIVISITGIIGGWISDNLNKRKLTSITTSRKLLTTISSLGPALGLIGVIYAGCDKVISIIMFTIGMGLMGFYYASLAVNPIDLSPNYAGTATGIIGYGTISGIISPYLTGVITTHHTLNEWHIVFGFSIGMLSISSLIFILFGSGKVQPWDQPKERTETHTQI